MRNENKNTRNKRGGLIGCLSRMVSRVKCWQAFLAVLMLCIYNDSAIVLRVNNVGLMVKHADTWLPEFQSKAKLLSD